MKNNMSIINIHKAQGQKKDAVRVNKVSDVPEFLSESIIVEGDSLKLVCVEGMETAPLGVVIGYEKSEATPTGWNCWVIGNAAESLIEIDGVFYKKAIVYRAQQVGEELPDFLKGANAWCNADGSWSIQTDWGVSTGFPGKAYWVLYGVKPDGAIDANILTKTEKSYKDYIVCDENGTDIGMLCEIDPV